MSSAKTTKANFEAISAILVDDERLARKALRALLKDHPSIKIVGEADGVEEASKLVEELHPEVIFLDVQMIPLDGFHLVNLLALQDSPPKIIFVTAYEKFAIAAFEAHALDYLTKPVVPTRLARTIARLESAQTLKESAIAITELPAESQKEALVAATPFPEEIHVLRDGNKVRIVRTAEIHTIRAEGSYTHLQIAGGSTLMIRKSITAWEVSLSAELFLRISKSLLINRRSIRSVDLISRNVTHLHLRDFPEPLILSRLEGQRLRKALAMM